MSSNYQQFQDIPLDSQLTCRLHQTFSKNIKLHSISFNKLDEDVLDMIIILIIGGNPIIEIPSCILKNEDITIMDNKYIINPHFEYYIKSIKLYLLGFNDIILRIKTYNNIENATLTIENKQIFYSLIYNI